MGRRREYRLIGESPYTQRLEELRQAYLSGAIGAEEYGRLRQEVVTGQPAESAEAPAAPPPPRPRRSASELDLPPGTHVVEPAPFVPPAPVAPSTATLDPWADPVTGLRLASWGRRAVALLLDVLLLGASLWAVAIAFGASITEIYFTLSTSGPRVSFTGEADPTAATVLTLQTLFLPSLYAWIMLGARGATMGKLTVGIVVRKGADGARIGFARAALRVAAVFVLGILAIPLLVSYLWPIFDRRAQTFQDKIAKTIVVMERR
jgi:uncharacterized RDD family membrane protein YckC